MRLRSLLFVGTVLGISGLDGDPLSRTWQRMDGGAWQIASESIEEPSVSDAREGRSTVCPAGMIAIDGTMRSGPEDAIERLQDTTCLEWQPNSFPGRCLRFDADRWRALMLTLPVRPMRFCIDRFEYPNRRGAFPVISVTWHEARNSCAREAKRLCTEDEWTFACEGEEAKPYPYGYARDDEACVIDRQSPAFNPVALSRRDSFAWVQELDRLWRGEPSGAYERCRSPFGVRDLTGNVDEWTTSTRSSGFQSILKGGYWGPIRARCRPSTRAHGEGFAFYQQGFRCCADIGDGTRAALHPE